MEGVESVEDDRDQQKKKKCRQTSKWTMFLINQRRKKPCRRRRGAPKKKTRPGTTQKPIRAPKLEESPSSSSYEDETDKSNDEDGKHVTGSIVQKPAIANTQ